jgi:hypothetical protein
MVRIVMDQQILLYIPVTHLLYWSQRHWVTCTAQCTQREWKMCSTPTEDEPTPRYKNKTWYELRLPEAWFVSYSLLKIKENAQRGPPWASAQVVACLNSDCRTGWKIPGVVRIISYPFSICCCKSWMSLTDFCSINSRLQMSPEIKI